MAGQEPTPPPGYEPEAEPAPPPGYELESPLFGKKVRKKRIADLPEELPETMLDKALGSLPYLGAAGATLLTGGGALPMIAAASLGAGAGSIGEQGLREVMNQRPRQYSGDAFDKTVQFAQGTLNDMTFKGAVPEMGGQVINAAVVKPLMHYFNPERLAASHLQPAGVTQDEMMKSVRGMLREGKPLGRQTAAQAKDLEESLRNQVENMINSLPKNVDSARMQAVLKGRLDILRKRFGRITGLGPEFVKQINEFEADFASKFTTPGTPGTPAQPAVAPTPATYVAGHGYVPATPGQAAVPATPGTPPQPRIMQSPELQDIKQGTAEFVRTKGEGNFGPNVHPGLNIRMQKEVMKVAKAELERLYGPELKDLNLREGDMIALNKAAEKWATNYMRSGASPGVPLGAGDLAKHLAKKFLGSPEFNTALAIDLARWRQYAPVRLGVKILPRVAPNVARGAEYKLRRSTEDQ